MRLRTIFSVLILATCTAFGADPQQPKVGGTPVINATNGYGGNLTIRTQLNVGYAGQTGAIGLSSTNGTYTITLSVDANGALTVAYGTTNMLTLLVGSNAGYGGTGNKVLTDNGAYQAITSPPGAVVTNININPTDGYLPYRSNSTTFGNSPMHMVSSVLKGLSTVGSGTTPYVWSTSLAHVSGYLTEIQNNFSDKVSIDFRGGLLGGWATQNGDVSEPWVFYSYDRSLGDTPSQVDGGIEYIDSQDFNYYTQILTHNITTATQQLAELELIGRTNGGPTTAVRVYVSPQTTFDGGIDSSVAGTLRYYLYPNSGVSTLPYLYDTALTHTSGTLWELDNHGSKVLGLDTTGGLSWSGNTNALYRSGADLLYTNSGAQPKFYLKNNTGGYISIGPDTSGMGVIASSGGTIYMDQSVVTRALTPFQPGYVLGQLGNPWTQAHALVSYISPAFNNGGTNYAYLKTSLATTNGPIEFLSAANGTAGSPKAMNFSFGTDLSTSTNYVQIDANETAGETGLLLRRNGSIQRVSLGIADSGGSGFKVLRVPN